jgi:hypothetical protein
MGYRLELIPRSAWSIECGFGTRAHRDVKEIPN